jgi:hypothetical protein
MNSANITDLSTNIQQPNAIPLSPYGLIWQALQGIEGAQSIYQPTYLLALALVSFWELLVLLLSRSGLTASAPSVPL